MTVVDWRIDIEPWQDGYGWKVTNLTSGYVYSCVMYDDPIVAQIAALRHIVVYQGAALQQLEIAV